MEDVFKEEFRFALKRIRPNIHSLHRDQSDHSSSTVLPSRRFLRIYGFFFFSSIFARAEDVFKRRPASSRERKKRSWIGVKAEAWEGRKVLEGLRLEEGGCWDGEVVSTSGPWSPRTVASLNERDFWPRIKGQKWLEGRLISSSRFYSLRIKQKPKLLKLRSRLSWIHARVPWTGVPLLSGSRDPLCSSWTPRRSQQLDTTPKHPGDVYVSFIPRSYSRRSVHLQLSPRI